jgi:hypothetical protein
MIKDRLLSGWTFTRVAYLIIGIMVIIQAAVNDQWLGILLGAYVTSMGLFAFGCASGSCFDGSCRVKHDPDQEK